MDALKIIKKYYDKDSLSYNFIVKHSTSVARAAIKIVEHNNLDIDKKFITDAAMLHDIGIFLTYAPSIGCFGKYPYIAHGYLGRELLEKHNLRKIALVCERHIGVGISLDEIIENNLPLPKRNMLPLSLEEKIICYADKFFSKRAEYLETPKPIEIIKHEIAKYGKNKIPVFENMINIFGWKYIYKSY